MTGQAWQGGSTRAWRRTRARVLARDRGLCLLQLGGCTVRATCVHHVLGRESTGDEPAYLVAACESCNLRVGDPRRKAVADPRPEPRTKW